MSLFSNCFFLASIELTHRKILQFFEWLATKTRLRINNLTPHMLSVFFSFKFRRLYSFALLQAFSSAQATTTSLLSSYLVPSLAVSVVASSFGHRHHHRCGCGKLCHQLCDMNLKGFSIFNSPTCVQCRWTVCVCVFVVGKRKRWMNLGMETCCAGVAIAGVWWRTLIILLMLLLMMNELDFVLLFSLYLFLPVPCFWLLSSSLCVFNVDSPRRFTTNSIRLLLFFSLNRHKLCSQTLANFIKIQCLVYYQVQSSTIWLHCLSSSLSVDHQNNREILTRDLKLIEEESEL